MSSSTCVVDASGKIIKEAKALSEPEALIAWFQALPFTLARIGLEAGPLSQWRYAGLKNAGFAAELPETRHVRDAFKAMETDRNDARGIAQFIRLGWFRPVHCKSAPAQETRALPIARKLVQAKLYDVQMSLRGILRGFGLKVGAPRRWHLGGSAASGPDGILGIEIAAARREHRRAHRGDDASPIIFEPVTGSSSAS